MFKSLRCGAAAHRLLLCVSALIALLSNLAQHRKRNPFPHACLTFYCDYARAPDTQTLVRPCCTDARPAAGTGGIC